MYTGDMATSLKKQPKPKKKPTKRQQEARANYKRGYDAGFTHIDMWGIPALYAGGTRLDTRNMWGHYRRGFVDGWNDNLELLRLK